MHTAPVHGNRARQRLTFDHVDNGKRRRMGGAAGQGSASPPPQRNQAACTLIAGSEGSRAKQVRFGEASESHAGADASQWPMTGTVDGGAEVTPRARGLAEPRHLTGKHGVRRNQVDVARRQPWLRGSMRAVNGSGTTEGWQMAFADSRGTRLHTTMSPTSKKLRGGAAVQRPDRGDAALAEPDAWHWDVMCKPTAAQHKCRHQGVNGTTAATQKMQHNAARGLQHHMAERVGAMIQQCTRRTAVTHGPRWRAHACAAQNGGSHDGA